MRWGASATTATRILGAVVLLLASSSGRGALAIRAKPTKLGQHHPTVSSEEGQGDRILRLTGVAIDRFLTNAAMEGKNRERMKLRRSGAATAQAGQLSSRAEATELVKLIRRNLKAMGLTLAKFDGELKQLKHAEEQDAVKISGLEGSTSALMSNDPTVKELTVLRTQNKALLQDKAALVGTLQDFLKKQQPQVGELSKQGEHEKELPAQVSKEFQSRIEELEKEALQEQQSAKELTEQIEQEKQKNADAEMLVKQAHTNNAEIRVANEGVEKSVNKLQDENEGLVNDKGHLMGTMTSLLKQNSDLKKQVGAAKRKLGMAGRREEIALIDAARKE